MVPDPKKKFTLKFRRQSGIVLFLFHPLFGFNSSMSPGSPSSSQSKDGTERSNNEEPKQPRQKRLKVNRACYTCRVKKIKVRDEANKLRIGHRVDVFLLAFV